MGAKRTQASATAKIWTISPEYQYEGDGPAVRGEVSIIAAMPEDVI
jgi:hypothetical protein